MVNQRKVECAADHLQQGIVACQKENGWLGNGFHGQNKEAGPYENQESVV